jgi:PA14 domain/F5/8 type C domain
MTRPELPDKRPSGRIVRYRIPLTCLIAGFVGWGLLAGVRFLARGGDGLTAQYYANADWAGTPVLAGADAEPTTAEVERHWRGKPPAAFSVIWSGYLAVGSPGQYEFATSSDDGSTLYIDGRLVVDNGGRHSTLTRSGSVQLERGPHRVLLEYVQAGGGFSIDWTWAHDGGPVRPPAWLLSQQPAGYSVALAAHVAGMAAPVAALLAGVGALWVFVLITLDGLWWWASAWTEAHLPAGLVRAVRWTLAALAIVLPVALILHAFAFWGRGLVDDEATSFIVNYLARRPLVATIFDPRLNDWGAFQARELSYALDLVDARVFAALLVRHVFLLVPLSGALGLVAAAVVYYRGARKTFGLDRVTTGLLLSVFLSCVVTQASTAIFYRSSKILLTVCLFAFLFLLTSLVRARAAPGRSSRWALLWVFALGFTMSISDRQGFFYLVAATAVVGALWVKETWLKREAADADLQSRRRSVLVAGATAAVAGSAYNRVLGPEIILHVNGYWPDLSYQNVPLSRLDPELVRHTLEMLGGQVSYFFGNLPPAVIGGGAAALCLMAWSRRRTRPTGARFVDWLTSDGLLVAVALAGGLAVLLGAMIMRHPPVFSLRDHSFFYYTLTMQAVFLFGLSMLLSRNGGARTTGERTLIGLALLAMVGGNVWHYGGQRALMERSSYLGKNYAFSQLYAGDFEIMEGRRPGQERSLPSWMRVEPAGAVVDFPITEDSCFLDDVEAAHATLVGLGPWAAAVGPHWDALRTFLGGPASPVNYAGEIGPLIEALRAIGVHRILVHPDRYRNEALAQATIDAVREAPDATVSGQDGILAVELAHPGQGLPVPGPLREIPRGSFHVTASQAADLLPLALDGDPETEWISGTRQTGDEWIRVDFDRPRAVARIRMDLTDHSRGNYPRRLVIEAGDPGARRTLYDASPLASIMRGILQDPARSPIEIDLPPTPARTLIVRQTGRTDSWNWSIHELALFEAAR